MRTWFRLRRAPVLAVTLFMACKDDTGSGPESWTLIASPQVLSFSDVEINRPLYLATAPSGGRLEWQVTAKPTWLSVEPMSGVINGDVVTVQVSANGLATAEPGTMTGKLELISNGGSASINLEAVVAPNPVATLSPSIAVPATADTGSFTITNTGRGILAWQAVSPGSWMTLVPASGALAAGQVATVRISVDKAALSAGTMTTTITLKTNSRAGDLAVPVSIVVPPTPQLAVSTSRIVFPFDANTRPLRISNSGNGPLNWSIAGKDSWLTLSPSSGTLAAGDSTTITVSIDRQALSGPQVAGTFFIASNAANSLVAIAIDVANTAPPRVLDHRVVDAEFSSATSMIVTVSAAPNRLNVVDVNTWSSWFVPLPLAPTSVSVRPDGGLAAVGHDGFVTIVNLLTRSVSQSPPVSTEALDVVLASNGFVYVFPRRDQWASIFAINLSTGAQSQGAMIYAGTLGRLHPSGDYIYGANNGLSPSDFEKYDIRQGTPSKMYDSPYHGQYSFNGNLWFIGNGTRIVARSGNVFRSSPIQALDMVYAGRLSGVSMVRWAADAPAKSRLYVLANSITDPFGDVRTPSLTLFETSFLAPVGTYPLPRLTGGGGESVDVDGQFVFASADGSKIYVLLNAVASAGLNLDWAIAVLETSRLP